MWSVGIAHVNQLWIFRSGCQPMGKSRVRQKREAAAAQTAGSSVFWCGLLGVTLALLLALHLWSASSQQLHITAPLREDGSKLREEPLTSVASDAETDSAALAADFFEQVPVSRGRAWTEARMHRSGSYRSRWRTNKSRWITHTLGKQQCWSSDGKLATIVALVA